jgi:hypothetical protein
MDGVKTCLSSQVADFFEIGIQKLISRYDKCLNSSGNYVEKQLKDVPIFLYNIFFLIACFVNGSPEFTF